MLISCLNDVDIQLILEFKNSFGKYHQVYPITPKKIIKDLVKKRFVLFQFCQLILCMKIKL